MERTAILDMMDELKLSGMRRAYDEILAGAIKREHAPPRVVGDLLKAEIAEKHARSITYQLTLAKLPLAKDVDDFAFARTPRLSQRTKHLSQRGQRRSRLRARCPSRPLNLHR